MTGSAVARTHVECARIWHKAWSRPGPDNRRLYDTGCRALLASPSSTFAGQLVLAQMDFDGIEYRE